MFLNAQIRRKKLNFTRKFDDYEQLWKLIKRFPVCKLPILKGW
jgi:hypothetical protein